MEEVMYIQSNNVYEKMWRTLEFRAYRTNNKVVLDAMAKIKEEHEVELREYVLEVDDGR